MATEATLEQLLAERARRQEQPKKPKTILGRVGKFLAPTTSGAIESARAGEGVTGRQLLGSAFEIGSFVIPSTAILKGLSLAGRGIRAATGVSRAAKVAATEPIAALREVGAGVAKAGKGIASAGLTTAKVGGTSGALFGAGRALGDPDATIKEIAGEAAISGGIGFIGGGALGLGGGVIALGGRKGIEKISQGVQSLRRHMKPGEIQQATKVASEGMRKSFDDATVTQIDDLLVAHRKKGGPQTGGGFFDELVEHNLFPTPTGKIFNLSTRKTKVTTRPALDEASNRIAETAKWRSSYLKTLQGKVSADKWRKQATELLEGRTDADQAAFSQLTLILKNQLKGKTTLAASDINEIMVRLNQGKYTLAGNMMARAGNDLIGNLIPKGATQQKLLNAYMSKHFRMKETLNLLNGRDINIGFFSEAAGRYGGLILAGLLGSGLGPANPLFIAALFSQFGVRALSSFLSHMRFSGPAVKMVRQAINPRADLKKQLLDGARNKKERDIWLKILGD